MCWSINISVVFHEKRLFGLNFRIFNTSKGLMYSSAKGDPLLNIHNLKNCPQKYLYPITVENIVLCFDCLPDIHLHSILLPLNCEDIVFKQISRLKMHNFDNLGKFPIPFLWLRRPYPFQKGDMFSEEQPGPKNLNFWKNEKKTPEII